MDYLKKTTTNGTHDESMDTVVSARFVENYTSKETLAFFRNLGGTEKVTRHRNGRITVLSESPDKDISKFTEFTPVI